MHAERFIVVDADDGNLLWHGKGAATARIEDAERSQVMSREDADWLGKAAQPFGEILLPPFPAFNEAAPREG
jgi:hypothetical protein